MKKDNFINIAELMELCKQAINDGHGNYIVIYNDEYYLAQKGDLFKIKEDARGLLILEDMIKFVKNIRGYD